ncbi:MAG: hypothetical protein R6W82_08795, partial [bacterium]
MKVRFLPRRVVYLSLVLAASCGGGGTGITLTWEPAGHLNASLPSGIEVFEGASHIPPIKAWHVRVREEDPRIETRVAMAREPDARQTVAAFAEREDAVLAVNGGYFRMDRVPAEHVGLLYIGGKTVNGSLDRVRRDSLHYPVLRGSLGLFEDGRVDVAWAASRGDTLLEWPRPPANR